MLATAAAQLDRRVRRIYDHGLVAAPGDANCSVPVQKICSCEGSIEELVNEVPEVSNGFDIQPPLLFLPATLITTDPDVIPMCELPVMDRLLILNVEGVPPAKVRSGAA